MWPHRDPPRLPLAVLMLTSSDKALPRTKGFRRSEISRESAVRCASLAPPTAAAIGVLWTYCHGNS